MGTLLRRVVPIIRPGGEVASQAGDDLAGVQQVGQGPEGRQRRRFSG
jgi:hypothetical protein